MVMFTRHRYRYLAQAVAVGLLTGAVSVGFHQSVDLGDALRNRLIELAMERTNFGERIVLGMTLLCVIISAGLVIRFAPEASGSGIPHLKGVLLGRLRFRWFRVLVIKFSSTVIGVTGGLILGRGGPSVHMGGAIGQGIAKLWPGKAIEDRSILAAAGGGAGLTAAFNAPLAGMVFVLEELGWRFATIEFFTTAIACLAADMVCRSLLGQYPAFNLTFGDTPPMEQLIGFLPLGLLSGFLGGLFTRSFLKAQMLSRLPFWPRLTWWLVLAAGLTLVAC